MSSRIRGRLNVILQMVMALITVLLLAQLWLFTLTLDAMENGSVSGSVVAAAAAFSLVACGSIWMLIRYFLRTEAAETGERR